MCIFTCAHSRSVTIRVTVGPLQNLLSELLKHFGVERKKQEATAEVAPKLMVSLTFALEGCESPLLMTPGLRCMRHSSPHTQEHMSLEHAAPVKGTEDVLPLQALELGLGS